MGRYYCTYFIGNVSPRNFSEMSCPIYVSDIQWESIVLNLVTLEFGQLTQPCGLIGIKIGASARTLNSRKELSFGRCAYTPGSIPVN